MTLAHAFLVACSMLAAQLWIDPPAMLNDNPLGVIQYDRALRTR